MTAALNKKFLMTWFQKRKIKPILECCLLKNARSHGELLKELFSLHVQQSLKQKIQFIFEEIRTMLCYPLKILLIIENSRDLFFGRSEIFSGNEIFLLMICMRRLTFCALSAINFWAIKFMSARKGENLFSCLIYKRFSFYFKISTKPAIVFFITKFLRNYAIFCINFQHNFPRIGKIF